jgi:serine protease Do
VLNVVSIRLVTLIVFAGLSCVSTAAREHFQPSSEVLARVKSAVVLITTYDKHGAPDKQGSGFFLTPDRVVTNFHVVNTASQIRVSTFNGNTIGADLILAADQTSDLALLQLDAPCPNVVTLALAEAEPLEGEPLMLVSNPLGEPWQVSIGEVGPAWNFFAIGERLQITPGVLPGSSGAPVLNLAGQVIGIAVMYVKSTDNLNFAVPVARLKALQANLNSPHKRR